MMCIKHVLIYFLVLPIPATSPIFLLLFTAAAFIAIKPCGYCLSLLAILFLSTSPHSPFLHPSLDSPSKIPTNTTTSSPSISQLALNEPSPDRKWISLNGGRYSSPNLIGYREMDKAISSSSFSSDASSDVGVNQDNSLWKRIFAWDLGQSIYYSPNPNEKREITGNFVLDKIIQPYLPPSPSLSSAVSSSSPSKSSANWRQRELPKSYRDFSWKGIGFIVDFGLKRSDQGIKWEIEEVLGREWIRPSPEDEQKVEEVKPISSRSDKLVEPDTGLKSENNGDARIEDKNDKAFWRRIPLIGGSW